MVSEGASVHVNLQPCKPLRFPRGLAPAAHPRDFKGQRKVMFCLSLQFPSLLPLDAVSPRRRDVPQDRLYAELL